MVAADRVEMMSEGCPITNVRTERKAYTTTLDKSQAHRGFFQHLAVWLWIGWMFFYCVFLGSLPVLYFYFPSILAFLVGLMTLSAVMPIEKKSQPKWAIHLGEFILFRAAEYFHMKMVLVNQDLVMKSGPAIFAIEPHDILPLSIFSFNDCLEGLKGHKCLGCVTSVCFYIPIMKHIYSWVNARGADKKNLQKMLKDGFSPVLCPGGVQEVTLMKNENECVLYLNSRFGFIKLALQEGVPIIPCFCFGLRKTFRYWIPKNKFLVNIGRSVGVLPVLFFGIWNLPFAPCKPVNYTNIVGIPIILPKITDPTKEDIEKYLSLFIKGISDLYEDNKKDYDMENISLRIA